MSMIEGVGDEVTVCFGIGSVLSLMILAWLSTHVNDPIIRVIVLERDAFRRLIQRIRNIQTGGSRPAEVTNNSASPSESTDNEQRTSSSTDTDAQPAVTGGQTEEATTPETHTQEEQAPASEGNEDTTPAPLPTNVDTSPSKSSIAREIRQECDRLKATESVPAPSVDTTPVNTSSDQPTADSTEHPSTDQPIDIPDGSIRIKIKYLDDRQKIVYAKPDITVMKFKSDNFSAEISENLAVRFIYNGQELRQDGQTLQSYNVQNDSVIHCLLSRAQPAPTAQPPVHNPNIDIGFLMFPLFGLILALIWYCRFSYRNYFNAMSTFSLIGITFLFIVATLATFRHQGEGHEHQE